MAFKSSTAYNDATKKKDKYVTDVENYGGFTTSDSTNKYLQDRDNAYSAVQNYGDFNASEALLGKEQKKTDAENAVANYGTFDYALQQMYDDARNNAVNFKYDVNGDALYQQYKDQYLTQGKLAMQDAMGQAAAMTGGYGNSYAASVGQQAYQGYVQQLNDKVPELYQLAYENAVNKYNLLRDDRATAYNEWGDAYNRKVAERDYYGTDYYKGYDQEYGQYVDKYGRLTDQYNLASDAYNTGWNQDYTTWESGLNQLTDLRDAAIGLADDMYNQEYGQYRDTVADQQWKDNFDESVRQYDNNLVYDATGTGTTSKGTKVTKTNTGTGTTASIPKYVETKLATFTNNEEMGTYLDSLVNSGVITESQADGLYATYNTGNEYVDLNNRKWTMTDDGGVNWGWGIDNNAKVKDQYGNEYKLKDLQKELEKTMGKDEAKAYVKKLQKDLGI